MKAKAPSNLNLLNKIICEKCGIPLILSSYEKKINSSINSEKITIKLICKNYNHTKINEIEFDEYNKLIRNNYHKICRCTFCNKLIENTPNYCYDCQRIICSNCIFGKHKGEHNCIKYDIKENKCLIHHKNNNNNEITLWCKECEKNMCKYCSEEDLNHLNNNKILKINDLNNKNNISKIQKEQKNLMKQDEIIKNQIDFNEFLINYYNKL